MSPQDNRWSESFCFLQTNLHASCAQVLVAVDGCLERMERMKREHLLIPPQSFLGLEALTDPGARATGRVFFGCRSSTPRWRLGFC